MSTRLAPVLTAFILATSLASQYAWVKRTPTAAPLGRQNHAMVYDAARGVTVLFGGFNGTHMNDMWTWDGSIWRSLSPTPRPSPRSRHTMAYDPIRERVVLIGGLDWTGPLNDTWEWDGTKWIAAYPNGRNLTPGGGSAYYPALGGVLFNWDLISLVWDGSTWNAPPFQNVYSGSFLGSANYPLMYDPTTDTVLAFRSQHTYRCRAGVGWTDVQLNTDFNIQNPAASIDPLTGRAVMYGGEGSPSTSYLETRLWDGNAWTLGPGGPNQSTRGAMAFDLTRRVFVFFGSMSPFVSETWELTGTPNPTGLYSTFGQGCSGASSYRPSLSAVALLGGVPSIGGVQTLRLDGLPPGQPTFGFLGASNTSWGSIPLPLDLGFLTMQGCSLFVSADATSLVATSSATGTGYWSLAVPNQPSLIGQYFYQQVIVRAGGANPLGFLSSNAGAGRVGLH